MPQLLAAVLDHFHEVVHDGPTTTLVFPSPVGSMVFVRFDSLEQVSMLLLGSNGSGS